jgi:hypothetical protein
MTNDFEDDACDALDKTEAPYMIITCLPDSRKLRIRSNLGNNNAATLLDMCKQGDFSKTLAAHLKQNYTV